MQIIKPSKLNIGDTIGIVAPSLPVLPGFKENFEKGKKTLQDLGFNLKEGKTIGLKRWYSAGTPDEQAEDINLMFADQKIKAVIAQTGGHTGVSVLEHLDYRLIKSNPKPFIGMSDMTVFHLAILTKSNLVGFHMDDVTFGMGWNWNKGEEHLAEFGRNMFLKTLTSAGPIGVIEPLTEWECWREGEVSGPLIGGNLHLLSWQIGTPYFPPLSDFDGAILFWEDFGDHIYNFTRTLYQLKYLGIFDRITGMLVGKSFYLKKSEDEGVDEPSLKEAVLDVVKDYKFPILANMDFGHYTVNIPMPLGIKAKFNAGKKNFEIIEGAVQ